VFQPETIKTPRGDPYLPAWLPLTKQKHNENKTKHKTKHKRKPTHTKPQHQINIKETSAKQNTKGNQADR